MQPKMSLCVQHALSRETQDLLPEVFGTRPCNAKPLMIHTGKGFNHRCTHNSLRHVSVSAQQQIFTQLLSQSHLAAFMKIMMWLLRKPCFSYYLKEPSSGNCIRPTSLPHTVRAWGWMSTDEAAGTCKIWNWSLTALINS